MHMTTVLYVITIHIVILIIGHDSNTTFPEVKNWTTSTDRTLWRGLNSFFFLCLDMDQKQSAQKGVEGWGQVSTFRHTGIYSNHEPNR